MRTRPPARPTTAALAVLLTVFVLVEVNYPHLSPLSQLAIFATLGLLLTFLRPPTPTKDEANGEAVERDVFLGALRRAFGHPALSHYLPALLSIAVGAWLVVQTEPAFEGWWLDGRSLGDRAGAEGFPDLVVGVVGLLLVLEAARRTVGLALPLLSVLFLAYAVLGPSLPDFLLPHRGYGVERIVSQTFLHSQGVFGIALKVMFTYVLLFVVFGALLEATGATRFLVDTSKRLFGGSAGGPAKVAVLSSGLMGSLSGSAVANTATTGTLTIPMMRSAGFRRETAAGMEAAASSGGALVPPVMGAGAYMMLEIVTPPVTYLEILQAALLPAVLYYVSLFLMVHFRGRRLGRRAEEDGAEDVEARVAQEGEDQSGDDEAGERGSRLVASGQPARLAGWEAVVFVASLGVLIGLLLAGFTVFRAATLAVGTVLLMSLPVARTRLGGRRLIRALVAAARASVPLVTASACVGVILGVVTLTGAGTRLPALILPLAQDNLLAALLLIMVSSLILGMGLPSSVCYLLLATLVGPVLGRLGVVPLAAHLFIFYFGMMSMVTPPVALAAYAASSLAGSKFWATSWAAFRFSLAGFALPYLFVYRPELLMMAAGGGAASPLSIALATAMALLGILPLAASVAGWWGRPLGPVARGLLVVSALLALFPGSGPVFEGLPVSIYNLAGVALLVAVWLGGRRSADRATDRATDRTAV